MKHSMKHTLDQIVNIPNISFTRYTLYSKTHLTYIIIKKQYKIKDTLIEYFSILGICKVYTCNDTHIKN